MSFQPPMSPPDNNMMGMPSEDERTMGMILHLSALSMFIIPFGNVLGPLVVWLVKKDESQFIDVHGKAALNFQISLTIVAIISGVLTVVLIGLLGLLACAIAGVVLPILAGLQAKEGNYYTFPYTYEFIK